MLRVAPDHHQTTVANKEEQRLEKQNSKVDRGDLKIGTGNERTPHLVGKKSNVEMEMERMQVNVRWPGNGLIPTNQKYLIYSGEDRKRSGQRVISDSFTSQAKRENSNIRRVRRKGKFLRITR